MARRVSPTERIRARIDELFASDRTLIEVLEEVARLSVRLFKLTAMEAEVEVFPAGAATNAVITMPPPATAADLATALDQLPLLERVPELPQPELRALFDSLRLQVAFQPAVTAVDVEVALFADEPPDRRSEVAEVQSVPPGGLGPDLRRLVRLRQRIRLRLKRPA